MHNSIIQYTHVTNMCYNIESVEDHQQHILHSIAEADLSLLTSTGDMCATNANGMCGPEIGILPKSDTFSMSVTKKPDTYVPYKGLSPLS
jgi:hypothetical protein